MKYDPDHNRWIFTFGFGHVHPETGASLKNHYVVLNGSYEAARVQMNALFGQRWAMQYHDEKEAGVEKWGLQELEVA